MFELADAFVSMPGGLGTFDETIEIITWRQLGLHDKPVLICDVAGSAAPLLAMIEAAIEHGFAAPEVRRLYQKVDGVAALLGQARQDERGRGGRGRAAVRSRQGSARSYQRRERRTIWTTESITGTSISTPTTVASAAPDWKPNRAMAVATASSKKLLAPISAEGPATHHSTAEPAVEPVGQAGVEVDLDQDRHRQQRDHQRLARRSARPAGRTAARASAAAPTATAAPRRAACGRAPPARRARSSAAPPELRHDHRHDDVEHDRQDQRVPGHRDRGQAEQQRRRSARRPRP